MIYPNSTAIPRQDLAAVVVAARGNGKLLICDQILPYYPVTRKNARLLNLTIAGMEMLRIMDKIVEPGGDVERITLNFDGLDVTVYVRKEETTIPDEVELLFGDYFPVEATATRLMEGKLDLLREYLTAVQLFNTTNFGSATNSGVAYTTANLATISLIADIQDAIQRVKAKGEIPNMIVMSSLVWQRIRRATLVQNFIVGSLGAGAQVTPNALQKAFAEDGIEKVLIGGAIYNNAASKATPSISYIWNNTYIWVGRAGEPQAEDIDAIETVSGAGATLYWEQYGMRTVETYRDEPKEQNVIRAKTSEVPTVLNGNCGTLIATQYS